MIDAGDGEAVERDVAIERLVLRVHVLDGLEVVQMLWIDIGDDADLGRQADEGAVALVGLDDHPLALAEARVRAPSVDDATGDDRRDRVPAFSKMVEMSDVVVVLPWVPVTEIVE